MQMERWRQAGGPASVGHVRRHSGLRNHYTADPRCADWTVQPLDAGRTSSTSIQTLLQRAELSAQTGVISFTCSYSGALYIHTSQRGIWDTNKVYGIDACGSTFIHVVKRNKRGKEATSEDRLYSFPNEYYAVFHRSSITCKVAKNARAMLLQKRIRSHDETVQCSAVGMLSLGLLGPLFFGALVFGHFFVCVRAACSGLCLAFTSASMVVSRGGVVVMVVMAVSATSADTTRIAPGRPSCTIIGFTFGITVI